MSMKMLHTGMTVDNLEDSIRFYQTVFGMELLRKVESTDKRADCAFLRSKDESNEIELVSWRHKSPEEKPKLDHIGFAVPSLDGFLTEVVKYKGTVLRGPQFSRVFETRAARVADPSGIVLEIIEG